jgi:hypothetical protein
MDTKLTVKTNNSLSSNISLIYERIFDVLKYSKENYFVIKQVQGFSNDSLYRLSTDLLSNYEKKYVNSFYQFLSEEYNLSLDSNLESLIGDDEVKTKVVSFLSGFQRKFNFIKRSVEIKTPEEFQEYTKILDSYFSQLDEKDLDSSMKFEILSDIPHDIFKIFLKKGFLGGFLLDIYFRR